MAAYVSSRLPMGTFFSASSRACAWEIWVHAGVVPCEGLAAAGRRAGRQQRADFLCRSQCTALRCLPVVSICRKTCNPSPFRPAALP